MHLPVILPLLLLPFSQNSDPTVLKVEITNIRNNRGELSLSLYSSPEEYPYKASRVYTISKDSLANGCICYQIKDLKPGLYGMAVLDDEDRSGGMNYNLLGLPTEGFGFANNVKPFLSRPDYRKCLFTIKPGKNRISMTIRYKT